MPANTAGVIAQNLPDAHPASPGSLPGPGSPRWRALQRPDPQVDFGVSMPLGGTMALAVLVLWLVLTPWQPGVIGAAMLVATAILLAPLRECLHLIAWPGGAGRRLECRRTGWTLSLRARCAGVVHRRQFLWLLALPFLLLSVLPVLGAAVVGASPQFLVVLTLLNAFASSGDVLAALLVMAQVPVDAVVREEGDEHVWGVVA